MAIRRKAKSSTELVRRAHLGSIENPSEVIELAKRSGVQTTPLDLESLFSILGISIEYSDDLDSEISGTLKFENDSWKCQVNNSHHKSRQRFTLAHELAHFILHRNDKTSFVDTTFFRSTDALSTMELEANQFAASVLMPETDFHQIARSGKVSMDEIAIRFGVSPPAVRVRARQLGYKV